MTIDAFLFDLRKRGVVLTAADDKLRVEARLGVLTDSDRRAMAQHKGELLAALTRAEAGLNDPFAAVRSLWPWLMGTVPISPALATLDLSTPTGDETVDAAADELRQTLLALAGASAWPMDDAALNRAFGRLVAADVLAEEDERGWLYPLPEDDAPDVPAPS